MKKKKKRNSKKRLVFYSRPCLPEAVSEPNSSLQKFCFILSYNFERSQSQLRSGAICQLKNSVCMFVCSLRAAACPNTRVSRPNFWLFFFNFVVRYSFRSKRPIWDRVRMKASGQISLPLLPPGAARQTDVKTRTSRHRIHRLLGICPRQSKTLIYFF